MGLHMRHDALGRRRTVPIARYPLKLDFLCKKIVSASPPHRPHSAAGRLPFHEICPPSPPLFCIYSIIQSNRIVNSLIGFFRYILSFIQLYYTTWILPAQGRLSPGSSGSEYRAFLLTPSRREGGRNHAPVKLKNGSARRQTRFFKRERKKERTASKCSCSVAVLIRYHPAGYNGWTNFEWFVKNV